MKKILLTISIVFILFISACSNTNNINEYIRFSGNDNQNNVRGRFYLTQSIDSDNITWSVDNSDVIDISNINRVVVNRPLFGNDNISVTLTAKRLDKEYKFKLTVLPLTQDNILNEYPGLKSTNHVFKEVSYNELLDLLSGNKDVLIYLGFPGCSFCQEYVPYFEDIARTNGLEDKIYYYNFQEIRKTKEVDGIEVLGDEFQVLIDLIKNDNIQLEVKNDLDWLLAPTFLSYKDKLVSKLFTGAVKIPGKEQHIASKRSLNNEEIQYLNDVLFNIVAEVVDCEC